MSQFVPMTVSGLTIDPFTNMPIVILKDASGQTALPIWIGLIEASSIATEIEKIEIHRPMTHDLIKTLLATLGAKVDHVEVNDLADNTFYSTIEIEHQGQRTRLDSRPSDALAVALRCQVPILVDQRVIQKSRLIEQSQLPEDQLKQQKWAEILENLEGDDFGKYKM